MIILDALEFLCNLLTRFCMKRGVGLLNWLLCAGFNFFLRVANNYLKYKSLAIVVYFTAMDQNTAVKISLDKISPDQNNATQNNAVEIPTTK